MKLSYCPSCFSSVDGDFIYCPRCGEPTGFFDDKFNYKTRLREATSLVALGSFKAAAELVGSLLSENPHDLTCLTLLLRARTEGYTLSSGEGIDEAVNALLAISAEENAPSLDAETKKYLDKYTGALAEKEKAERLRIEEERRLECSEWERREALRRQKETEDWNASENERRRAWQKEWELKMAQLRSASSKWNTEEMLRRANVGYEFDVEEQKRRKREVEDWDKAEAKRREEDTRRWLECEEKRRAELAAQWQAEEDFRRSALLAEWEEKNKEMCCAAPEGEAQSFRMTLEVEDGRLKSAKGKFKELVTPVGVTEIMKGAFEKNRSLRSVNLRGGVRKIERGAFSECRGLEEIIIPMTVSEIGAGAFVSCPSLKNIIIDERNPFYEFKGGCLIDKRGGRLIFASKDFNIPEDGSVTEIGAHAFSGDAELREIFIPEAVTRIGNHAFWNCNVLTEVILPGSLEYVGEGAFYSCKALKRIALPKGLAELGYSAFKDSGLASVTIPSTLKKIPTACFEGCMWLSSLEIKEGVTEIGDSAFANCNSLTEVRIPDSMEKIDSLAFGWCRNLKKVYIPVGVKRGIRRAFPEECRMIRRHVEGKNNEL